jgi:hypothetical protein
VVPVVPDVIVRQLRILTFSLPSTLAMLASIPGRFSWERVSCFALGMAGTPAEEVLTKNVAKILLSSEQGVKVEPVSRASVPFHRP